MNIYEIRVRGRLDAHWAAWFAGLTLTYEGDTTVLRGSLTDEAALHGVLTKIAGLNLHLVSVHVVEAGGADGASSDPSVATGDGTDEANGRDQAPMEASLSESAADTPVSKRKPRRPRTLRRKRPSA